MKECFKNYLARRPLLPPQVLPLKTGIFTEDAPIAAVMMWARRIISAAIDRPSEGRLRALAVMFVACTTGTYSPPSDTSALDAMMRRVHDVKAPLEDSIKAFGDMVDFWGTGETHLIECVRVYAQKVNEASGGKRHDIESSVVIRCA